MKLGQTLSTAANLVNDIQNSTQSNYTIAATFISGIRRKFICLYDKNFFFSFKNLSEIELKIAVSTKPALQTNKHDPDETTFY
jgi:hypothetical protein